MARAKDSALTLEEKLAQALVPVEEQPYEVPENWCWTRISHLCSLKNGRAFKPTDWSEVGVPIVRIQNLNDPYSKYNYFDGPTDEAHRLYGGELLFAWSGTPGTSFGAHVWQGKDAVLNQHIFRVDFDEDIVQKPYFKYAINQKLNDLISAAHGGAGLQHVTKGVFESTPIVLAPLAEQHRIVERIERLFSELDEAKEKAQAVIDGYEDRRAAILHRAFTGELTAHLAQQRTTTWQSISLKDVVAGFKYGTSEKSDYSNSGMPVLRIPNIGEGDIDFSDLKYLEGDTEPGYYVRENDVLIIRSNGSRDLVGKCAIVPATEQQYAYASFLIKIIPSEKVLPEYLVLFLNSSDARTQMFAKAKSSAGIHNINSKELGAIQMPLPETWEQLEIVNTAAKLLSKESSAKAAAERAIAQIDTMKKSTLARAFRGELGTNDPEDEPALDLLKRTLTNPEV